jgi:hypothetical protein
MKDHLIYYKLILPKGNPCAKTKFFREDFFISLGYKIAEVVSRGKKDETCLFIDFG